MNIKDKNGGKITNEDKIMEKWDEHFKRLVYKIQFKKVASCNNIMSEILQLASDEGLSKLTQIIIEIVIDKKIRKEWNKGIQFPTKKLN